MRCCWIVILFALIGCSPRVEPIPLAARHQIPGAAAPNGPWKAHGRLAVSWPGHHLEMDCYLRREGTTLHYALIADGGISLAQGQIPRAFGEITVIDPGPNGLSVAHAIPPTVHPDLAKHIDALERLFANAYQNGPPSDSVWDGNLRRQDRRQVSSTRGNIGAIISTRWYGGDPVLLRSVEGDGWPLEISDYRITPAGLMAHQTRAIGPLGAELRLRIDSVESLP